MNSVTQGFNFEKLSGKREKEREERERERGERKRERERATAGHRILPLFRPRYCTRAGQKACPPHFRQNLQISRRTAAGRARIGRPKFGGDFSPPPPATANRHYSGRYTVHAPYTQHPLLKSGLPTKNHGHRTTDAPGSERFPARGRKSSNGDFSAVRPPFCSPSVPLDCSPHDLQICKISQQTATVGKYCSGDGCR